MTTENKQKAKKGLKIVGIIAGAVLAIDSHRRLGRDLRIFLGDLGRTMLCAIWYHLLTCCILLYFKFDVNPLFSTFIHFLEIFLFLMLILIYF